MDAQCHQALLQNPMARAHALLLPQSRNVSKMTVIGDRQRFGLSVLERGFNIVHSDADAYWIKDPWPVLSHGDDIVAERIWGKPLSVVRAWGAAICTGWYFVRSTPAAIAVARATRDEIAKKRARQPNWQASDQYCLNVALHKRFALRWDGNQTMPPASSMATKYVDQQPSRGRGQSAWRCSHMRSFHVRARCSPRRSSPALSAQDRASACTAKLTGGECCYRTQWCSTVSRRATRRSPLRSASSLWVTQSTRRPRWRLPNGRTCGGCVKTGFS